MTSQPPASPNDTRTRLLQAALILFAEKGLDGTGIREIAAKAKANSAMVQYHFGGKEKLWRAAVDRVFGELSALLDGIAPDRLAAPAEMAALIRAGVRFLAANPYLLRLMNDECKRDSPRMRWLVERHGRRLYDATTALFTHGARRGFLVDLPAPHAYFILVGAAGMIFSQAPECRRLAGADPTTSDALIDAHADALIRLFVRG